MLKAPSLTEPTRRKLNQAASGFRHLRALGIGVAALSVLAAAGPAGSADTNSTYPAMYFHSQVQDAPECTATTNNVGKSGFPTTIGSPAATCPDAFGWTQFLGAIQAGFWENWANDETVWVSDPRPLCSSDSTVDCCFVNISGTPQVGYRDAAGHARPPAIVGGPGMFCPYIPGDYGGAAMTKYSEAKPVTRHNTTILRQLDPARVARQQEVELVYRNDSFVRYTTGQELYSQSGLAKLFARVSGEARNSIPYRPTGQGVSYPTDAVMFKVDWIPEVIMLDLGYISDHDNDPATPPQNPEAPYITMRINASTGDGKPYAKSLYYMAAITGSSKALPNWHWYAFEHVANLGRCDFTGCNDSFGFTTRVTIKAPNQPADAKKPEMITIDSNFITPHTVDDQLKDKSDLFDLGKAYPSGAMAGELAALFTGTGIANGANPVNPDRPQITDPAWKSYRLKGTQTQYFNRDGYTTIVGASITEGGFVNSASCMSCHVQASVNAEGTNGVPGVGGTGRLNLFGIGTVVDGGPSSSDFYDSGTTNQRAVQSDFVWGILGAKKAAAK